MSELVIDCRIVPLGDNEPLIPYLDSKAGILSMEIPHPRRCPKSLNIDGLMIFDMQEDGGLDSIEILYKLPSRFRSKRTSAFPAGEKYYRIMLYPNMTVVCSPDITPVITWLGNILRFHIKEDKHDARHKIGPDVAALLLMDKFIGIEIDLSPFTD